MRNKNFLKALVFFVLIIFVSSFAFAEELSSVIKSIDSQRYKLLQNDSYISFFKENYMNFNPDYAKSITQEEAISLISYRERKSSVSYEKAVEDVDLYFRLLRYRLGHYDILGGDKVFFEARDTVLSKLEKYKGKSVFTSKISSILSDSLSFVSDCHFSIDGHQIFYEYNTDTLKYETYLSGLYLEKDNNGYYLLGEKNKVYFDHCDCDNVNIVPMISKKGTLIYSLILYCVPNDKPSKSTVFFNSKSVTVSWKKVKSNNVSKGFAYKEVDNVAYVNLTGCGSEIENLLKNTALQSKEKDIVIIDLRSNSGTHGYSFLDSYIDSNVSLSELAFTRVGMTNHLGLNPGQERTELLPVSGKGTISKGNNLTIILVDNNTGCAPEEFSQYFRYITNSIVIGTNTKGHLDGGTVTYSGSNNYDLINLHLTNTGMVVTVSTCLSLYDNYELMVGKGFTPDIYVEDMSNIVDVVISLLKSEGYISEKTSKELSKSIKSIPKYKAAPLYDEKTSVNANKSNKYYEVKLTLSEDNPVVSFSISNIDMSKKYRVEFASNAESNTCMDFVITNQSGYTSADLFDGELKVCEPLMFDSTKLVGTVTVKSNNFKPFEATIRLVTVNNDSKSPNWYKFYTKEVDTLENLLNGNSITDVYDFSSKWSGKYSDWKNNPYK